MSGVGAERAYVYVALYGERRFYVGIARSDDPEHIGVRLRWVGRTEAQITRVRFYDVGPWCDKANPEAVLARNYAAEQYLADQLCRQGLEPVAACRACAGLGRRRASTVAGCLAHGGGSWGHPYPSTLALARRLYGTIKPSDLAPVALTLPLLSTARAVRGAEGDANGSGQHP